MADCFLYARLEQISPVIRALTWTQDAIMWLEHIPLTFLTETERAHGIRLEWFDPLATFDEWARGRIFAPAGELRWEQQDGKFGAVFCGESVELSDFMRETDPALQPEQLMVYERSYYLWGTSVKAKDLPILGLPAETIAFVELQIPRILRYPVSSNAKRVKLKVKEFVAADGTLAYARFVGLEEE